MSGDDSKHCLGWSKDDLKPQLFPHTRDGKVQLYSSQRRWVQLAHGWSRIGEGADGKKSNEFSHRVSSSSKGSAIVEDADGEARAVRSLVAQLCEHFYKNGWATGTSGGACIRVGGPQENRPWRVFVAPSGIQKEDMVGDDVFELDMDRNVVVPPRISTLKQSACTPLWYLIFKHRPSVKSIIHTHSINAQLATLLDPTESSKSLRITHLEMVKGVGHHAYDDVLEIPIIDNRPSEDMLADQFEEVLTNFPKANAVLVRRHGVFAWGDSWEQAKTQYESFDYLFQSAVEMKKMGVNPWDIPSQGTYRVGDETERIPKRQKTEFNGADKDDNSNDLRSNPTPILPRDGKHLLLDIEGCTTSISFVLETLFPFVSKNVSTYVESLTQSEQEELLESLKIDLAPAQLAQIDDVSSISSIVKTMVRLDIKAAGLKTMQGKMWKAGYENGQLKGHVYSDVPPALKWFQSHGVKVHIYSSGSVQAQELLFGHSCFGDLTSHFATHFDITTSGNKKKARSYGSIAAHLGISPSEIVFCSDSEAELKAAKEGGIGHPIMTVRAGNAPITAAGKQEFPQIFSLLQLCGV
ncbi:unnamed protein product [Cylindrotheca closterium]|uniref:Class II aldolase/adducin N-terminal domain-containing protein n=1 Tax=Cylindrotheca closterium TaxID=2856 RepID=A0AAD2CKV7_9STRA|nr:unnamed protein product [Cylindrotheca closterium]